MVLFEPLFFDSRYPVVSQAFFGDSIWRMVDVAKPSHSHSGHFSGSSHGAGFHGHKWNPPCHRMAGRVEAST